MATLDEARSAKAALRDTVAGLDGVIGVGVAPEFTTSLEQPPREYRARAQGEPGGSRGSQVEVLAEEVSVEQVTGPGGSWVLQVNVTDPRLVDKIPEEIDDVAVRVRVVGAVRAG
ncbi:hypothetical protein ACFQHV_11730 [Promicromonospora thailandica]|uniref:Uncharacterized protein n=1 Tax=Promicromonospora thailandica TaxID=765201 RepID=A0A9X2JWE1_9MICO|nr:hypothetical protein [Promicromonospora thailandica]MCP2265053.1 hypothetical protein [Promicromonospora thailandica]BFF19893.1 hypothetical protein GCM10025730_34140 [Promicromonospora thailandica]